MCFTHNQWSGLRYWLIKVTFLKKKSQKKSLELFYQITDLHGFVIHTRWNFLWRTRVVSDFAGFEWNFTIALNYFHIMYTNCFHISFCIDGTQRHINNMCFGVHINIARIMDCCYWRYWVNSIKWKYFVFRRTYQPLRSSSLYKKNISAP